MNRGKKKQSFLCLVCFLLLSDSWNHGLSVCKTMKLTYVSNTSTRNYQDKNGQEKRAMMTQQNANAEKVNIDSRDDMTCGSKKLAKKKTFG